MFYYDSETDKTATLIFYNDNEADKIAERQLQT